MTFQEVVINNDLESLTQTLDDLGALGFKLQVIIEHDSTVTLLLGQTNSAENFNYEVVKSNEDLESIKNLISEMADNGFYSRGFWQAGKGYTVFFEKQLDND